MHMKKLSAVMMAAAVISMVVSPMSAFAAGTNYSNAIGGTKTTTFDKYLVMDQQANVPKSAFTYAVTAGEAKSYSVADHQFEVLAGVTPNLVTMAGVGTTTANTIAFAPGDTTSTTANALVKDFDNTTEKVAIKTGTLDFSAVVFPEPGVYRYVLTESGTNQGIVNDADATRIVDVYVVDASEGATKKLAISGYVLHSNANDSPIVPMGDDAGTKPAGDDGTYDPAATKSQGFTNDYVTVDLKVRKEVAGNQASKDKYFEFTVAISNAIAGTIYDVDISGADATSGSNAATIAANAGKTNPTSITVGADGTATAKFYLQHGQEVKIQGLAKDTVYNVTENAEDYKSTGAAVTGYTDPVNGTCNATDLNTSYLNTRNGSIPTGVVMAIAPFAVITALGGFGAASVVLKKKKEEEE